jgi:predicted ATP-binding protein involved in virulence
MRVKRVFVERLFGLFDHAIPMNMPDRVTIIHAPNGFGKTAILRMIDGLFNSRYWELRAFPFVSFGIELEDGRTLLVQNREPSTGREKPRKARRDEASLMLTCDGNDEMDLGATVDPESLPFPVDAIDSVIPGLDRIGFSEWRNQDGEILGLDDVLRRYRGHLPFRTPPLAEEPIWFRELKEGVDVRFIRADRLVLRSYPSRRRTHEDRLELTPTVTRYSQELASVIGVALKRYGEVSQTLDRTFPVRLVSQSESANLSKDEIKDRLSEFEAKRKRLIESGLLDQESDPQFQVPQTIDEGKASVLSVYVQDVGEKLAVFDVLAKKIDLFKSIINRRFRHKRMAISKERGIVFTTDRDQPLDPTCLSSGEQHELVLLYELLFKVREDSLILIDEPEISLHLAWQEEFLRDLMEMTRLSSFDVLLATHSSEIISDRWDLTVELEDSPELQEAVR